MKSKPSSPCRHLVLVLGDHLYADSTAFHAFEPARRTGPKSCLFTMLSWDFLLRHEAMLAKNPRTVMQMRNAARLRAAIAVAT